MAQNINYSTKNLTKKLLEDLYYKRKKSLNQIGFKFGIHPFSVAQLMDKLGIKRRNSSEANYNYFNKKECFKIREPLNHALELLKNIALVLYWCEGTGDRKGRKRNTTLAFTNTDANMLHVWLRFLLEICSLNKEKIRIRLYLHKNQNGNELKKYWSKELKIPLSQFENVSYTKKISMREDYKGTIKIKVHNLKLYLLIKEWIADLKKKILEL